MYQKIPLHIFVEVFHRYVRLFRGCFVECSGQSVLCFVLCHRGRIACGLKKDIFGLRQ